MPTFQDPRADAAEASEALRGLAHASRVFDDPADTYAVFGDLTAGVRSLRQVLDQLATAHLAHQSQAFDDDGDHTVGATAALAAADELHQAGTLLDEAYDRLDAAFSHSGRIAWHPEPAPDQTASRERIAARLDGESQATTAQVGTLTLAVWPDTPVGEHQRYAYRITDTDAATGRELEGRDLFTGTSEPVEPDSALRDLSGYLSAAGEARQYALDHHGSTPENEGLFPAWVAEAARINADALSELGEYGPSEPEPTAVGRRWFSVVFLQGEEADVVLDLIDRDGTAAAIKELAGYDYGDESQQAALENGYLYDDQPPAGATDRTVTTDVYMLTYSHALGHVGLSRELDALPDPVLPDPGLLDIDTLTPAVVNTEQPRRDPAPQGSAARRAAFGADRDWFAVSATASGEPGRGLSL